MTTRIGIDFGTTNSGAALFDGQNLRVLPLDPASPDPTIVRSTLYITREHEVFAGREAVDAYYRQNVGRPSRLVRHYVGEIEMTFAELPTFVREVYTLVDELTPGRLIHSIKSELSGAYEGAALFGRFYSAEELVALYLREIKRRAEACIGEPIDGVVLGRPVHFVGGQDEAADQRAVQRLKHAAQAAGFRDVSFELEPVAAALRYEMNLSRPENIVVFDFGGGTLDVTVMQVGSPNGCTVLATGGLGIAGDTFDQRIIGQLLLEHFGHGTTWGQDALPFPDHFTDALTQWLSIPELNRPETIHILRQFQRHGSHPARIRALESLLVNNLAIQLIDAVEQAKIDLSTRRFTSVRLTDADIDLWQAITRTQFESLIGEALRHTEACLNDTLARSGLQPAEIDAVVRTGGSSQIPCFIDLIARIFGPDKITLTDLFSGVTAGLAISAYRHTVHR